MTKINCKSQNRKQKKTKNYYVQKLKSLQNLSETKNQSQSNKVPKSPEAFQQKVSLNLITNNIIIQKNETLSNLGVYESLVKNVLNINTNKNEIKQQKISTRKRNKQKKQGKTIARDARQRKKIYISFLQDSNKQLKNQLKQERQKNDTLLSDIKSLKFRLSQIQNSVNTIQLKKHFQNLYLSLKAQKQDEVLKSLDFLRLNYGISGRQRRVWTTNYLQKTVLSLMPMHFRLLMQFSENNTKFYSLLGGNQSMKEFKDLFKEQLTKNIILETRPLVLQAKKQYQKLLVNLSQIQDEFIKLSQKSQKIIDRIQDNLSPLFVGKLLLNLDTQRNKNSQIQSIFPINYYQTIRKPKNSFLHSIQLQMNECKIQNQETEKNNQQENKKSTHIFYQDFQAYFTQFQCYDKAQSQYQYMKSQNNYSFLKQ